MNYINILIIVILTIFLILILTLFINLYRKIKSSDKNSINLIEFPKETKERIDNFIHQINDHNKELKSFLMKEHQSAKNIITDIDEKIAPFERCRSEDIE